MHLWPQGHGGKEPVASLFWVCFVLFCYALIKQKQSWPFKHGQREKGIVSIWVVSIFDCWE